MYLSAYVDTHESKSLSVISQRRVYCPSEGTFRFHLKLKIESSNEGRQAGNSSIVSSNNFLGYMTGNCN